jgi:hypothetical protein
MNHDLDRALGAIFRGSYKKKPPPHLAHLGPTSPQQI